MVSKIAFCHAIRKWKDLEGMDVYEYSLKKEILEETSSSCKGFVSLRVARKLSIYDAPNNVRYLPKLKSVNPSNTDFIYNTLLIILKGCKELESLDITGCGDLGMDPEVQKFAAGLKKFQFAKGPFPEKAAWLRPVSSAADDYYECGIVNCSYPHGDY